MQHGRRRRRRASRRRRARRSAPDPEADAARSRGRPSSRSATLFRLLVFGALAAFLLYYVGPRDIAETAVKVVLAVVLTAALWVGANLLFDQAYDHWTRFNTIIGVAAGFLGYFVAEANGLFRTLVRRAGCGSSGQGVFDDVTGWRHAAARRQRRCSGG